MAGESQQTPNSAPDPSVLTTEQLERAVKAERDYTDGRIQVLVERLNGIDKATQVLEETVNRTPTDIQKEIAHLKELTESQFESAERLRVEQKKDTKDAVDAALNAAKEAVKEQTGASEKSIAKSEGATGAQIADLRRSIDELKDREVEDVRTLRQSITDVATSTNGIVQQKAGAREDRTGLYAALGAVTGLILFAIAIVGFLAARP